MAEMKSETEEKPGELYVELRGVIDELGVEGALEDFGRRTGGEGLVEMLGELRAQCPGADDVDLATSLMLTELFSVDTERGDLPQRVADEVEAGKRL